MEFHDVEVADMDEVLEAHEAAIDDEPAVEPDAEIEEEDIDDDDIDDDDDAVAEDEEEDESEPK